MTVQDIHGFDQCFCKASRNNDIQGMEAYAQKTNERIGTISDVLEGKKIHSCYFVLDIDTQTSTKKVLLPANRAQIDHEAGFVYVIGLSREQARYLPEFKESMLLDCDDKDM